MKKLNTIVIIIAAVVGFVLLSQPVWRGEEILEELKSDCDKRGGVLLEHKKTFGTNYQCASRLD